VCFYTELKQTVLNSWYVKTTGVSRGRQSKDESRGAIEAIVPPKTYELTLLAMMCAIRKTSFAIQGHFVIHCFVTEVL